MILFPAVFASGKIYFYILVIDFLRDRLFLKVLPDLTPVTRHDNDDKHEKVPLCKN